MDRKMHKFTVVLALAGLLAVPAVSIGSKPVRTRQERAKDGTYVAFVRGHYVGNGSADVSRASVSINADVHVAGGGGGKLTGSFTTTGPYFSGQGSLMGQPVTISGRVDAARASRVTATFWDANGHGARIVATLPNDTGDDTWDHLQQ
jgi:hypothetical protein